MRRFISDQKGGVLPIAGLLISVVVGVAAVAVDSSAFYVEKSALQNAADAGALAAALRIADQPAATAAAINIANKNVGHGAGAVTAANLIEFGTYDIPSKTFNVSNANVNAVRVRTERSAALGNAAPTFFGKIWGKSSTDIAASALAVARSPGACFYSLNPTASGALSLSGSGTLSVPNCGVQINSNHSKAATANGSSTVSAKSTCIVGGSHGGGISPPPKTHCPVLEDPLAKVPEPTPPAGCFMTDATINTDTVLQPNKTYCGKITLSGSAKITLQAGTYYFKGAELKLANSASISGTGVMIYLDATSTVDFVSSGTINLQAPQNGPYRGILFFQSRATSTTSVNKITGSPNMVLDGAIYMPKSELSMTGSGSILVKSGYVVADKFSFGGSANFVFDKISSIVASAFATNAVLVD